MIDMNALAANPAYLVDVLERNLLLPGTLKNRVTPNGVIRARISAHNGHHHCVNASDDEVPIFNLYNDGQNASDSVPAYLCSYVPRETHSVLVGAHANFMFTTTMNGCTLGIGPKLASGEQLVTHANCGGRTADQRADTAAAHGTSTDLFGVKVLEPATYRMGLRDMNATTFGIRVDGRWKFYFQSYQSIGNGAFRLQGIFPVL